MHSLFLWTSQALILLCMSFNVFASTDNSPHPGGVFTLKPGVYVAEGQTCHDPASAGLRQYDGKGIKGSATHSCVAKVISRENNRYTIDQSCIDTAKGPGPRTNETQTVVVINALKFQWGENKQATIYNYCPTQELPKWLTPND